MDTEDFVCNNRSNGQAIEGIDERLPDLDIAPSFAFIVEAIDARHIGAFMIAS